MAGIDAVDIGGASRVGVPKIPPVRDADGSSDDEGELLTQPVQPTDEVPAAVQKAVAPGVTVAYPSEHPAASGRLQQDHSGAMIVGKGESLSQSLLTKTREITPTQVAARERTEKELDKLLEEEERAKETKEDTIAKSPTGVPVIEVMFHTDIGAIVGYYNKVVTQGSWLILVTDNRCPAQAKFIPQPRVKDDGSHLIFEMVITGADRISSRVKATPLGIQFTVDSNDFIVMMLEPETPREE